MKKINHWLSMTNSHLLSHYTRTDSLIQSALGTAVLIAAIWAFVVGAITAYFISLSILVAVFGGLLYGWLILTFDRLVFSTHGIASIVARVAFLIINAYIFHLSLSLIVFNEQINKQVELKYARKRVEEMSALNGAIAKQAGDLKSYDLKIAKTQHNLRDLQSKLNQEINGAINRTDVSNIKKRGPRARAIEKEIQVVKNQISDIERQKNQNISNNERIITIERESYHQISPTLNALQTLPDRYEALKRLEIYNSDPVSKQSNKELLFKLLLISFAIEGLPVFLHIFVRSPYKTAEKSMQVNGIKNAKMRAELNKTLIDELSDPSKNIEEVISDALSRIKRSLDISNMQVKDFRGEDFGHGDNGK